jgi:hypothetical protein
MKKIKKIYKLIFVLLALLLNTYIGFQLCPNLISAKSNFLMILGFIILIGIAFPVYIILIKIYINLIKDFYTLLTTTFLKND